MQKQEWYWNKGLHDAEIIEISEVNLQYDYKQKNPIRNFLEIKINSKNALFDTTITSIRLNNYKILKEFSNLKGCWWFKDELSEENGKFKLKIYLHSLKQQQELEIVFESANIIRT